jgi:hypothetical protein
MMSLSAVSAQLPCRPGIYIAIVLTLIEKGEPDKDIARLCSCWDPF